MTTPRVYADFNSIEYADKDRHSVVLSLTGYGTLASLARQNIRLSEGMPLLLYEPDDIECEAVAHFDHTRIDPAGRIGAWIAMISDHREIRNCFASTESSNVHPCIACGHDLNSEKNARKNYEEVCSKCGTSVMEPMAPPKNRL